LQGSSALLEVSEISDISEVAMVAALGSAGYEDKVWTVVRPVRRANRNPSFCRD